eukprot:gene27047-biopygen17613
MNSRHEEDVRDRNRLESKLPIPFYNTKRPAQYEHQRYSP